MYRESKYDGKNCSELAFMIDYDMAKMYSPLAYKESLDKNCQDFYIQYRVYKVDRHTLNFHHQLDMQLAQRNVLVMQRGLRWYLL